MKRVITIFAFTLLSGICVAQRTQDGGKPMPEKSSVRFFPNPASTTITFELSTPLDKGGTIDVFTFLGKKIKTVSVNLKSITLNVSEFQKGLYIYQLRDNTGNIVSTNKFQVTR